MVMYTIGCALSVAAELFWVFLNCRKPCPEPCFGSQMAKMMVLACNASACEYHFYGRKRPSLGALSCLGALDLDKTGYIASKGRVCNMHAVTDS